MNPSNPSDSLQIGQVFEGKFKILRELGRGGFGMVYLAYQEAMDRYVALKALRPGIGLTAPSAKERFLREVRIISKLKHPNTVTIHDFGETAEGGLYMTLEYVEGETLKQLLNREGVIEAVRAAYISRQIAKSLSEAHRLGIVHRDLKPANIMITNLESEKDFVKVLDFGVARLLDPKTSDLTSVGLPDGERELIGTPRYMSPEQVRGEQLTGASDIYSLGLILYESLAGEAAVLGESTMGLISQQISPEALRLPRLQSFDPMLQDIVRICTAKAVHDRFQTSEQVADALEQFLSKSRSGRNALGSNSDMMASYQSQLNQMPSGWNPNSGWMQQPQQQGYPQQYDPRNQYGSGQHPSGGYPAQNPYQQPNPYQTMPPQPNPYQTMPPQPNPYQTMPPQQQGGYYDQPPQQPQQQGFTSNQTPYHSGQFSQGMASGAIPMQSHDALGEMKLERNADFEDFQATVERGSLDRSALRAAVGLSAGSSLSELPPPPQDERPFQAEPPKPTGQHQAVPVVDRTSAANVRPGVVKKDDDLMSFSLDIIKILGLVTAFLAISYVTFLIIGGALKAYTDGPLRIIASAGVIGVMTLLAAVGETSQRERFQVVTRTTDRVARILMSAAVFTLACGMLGAAIEADTVVRELRSEPNWFLGSEDSKFASTNRSVSHGVADGVASAMGALGLYDERRGNVKPTKNIVQPTRRSTRTPVKGGEESDNLTTDTKPRQAQEPKKSDYVKWE